MVTASVGSSESRGLAGVTSTPSRTGPRSTTDRAGFRSAGGRLLAGSGRVVAAT